MDGQQTGMTERPNGGISWINIVLGIWVLISPFVLGFGMFPKPMWNNVATGAAVGILALIRMGAPQQAGWSWINALLGIWLIISPFALGFLAGVALWNNVILGIIITIVAWSSSVSRMQVTA
jgi:uncharacterized membrane protein